MPLMLLFEFEFIGVSSQIGSLEFREGSGESQIRTAPPRTNSFSNRLFLSHDKISKTFFVWKWNDNQNGNCFFRERNHLKGWNDISEDTRDYHPGYDVHPKDAHDLRNNIDHTTDNAQQSTQWKK